MSISALRTNCIKAAVQLLGQGGSLLYIHKGGTPSVSHYQSTSQGAMSNKPIPVAAKVPVNEVTNNGWGTGTMT
jgi:hypothetical protein